MCDVTGTDLECRGPFIFKKKEESQDEIRQDKTRQGKTKTKTKTKTKD